VTLPVLREHGPLRPLWICRSCETPWPCATARLMLKGAYCDRRADLPVLMAKVMHQASLDLACFYPDIDLDVLSARFIGWAARRAL
jgi:hypothetical protein